MTSINCLEKKLISNSEFPEYTPLAGRHATRGGRMPPMPHAA
jgi:hypothetical protein